MRKYLLLLASVLFFQGCADVTPSGKKVHFVESEKDLLDYEEKADFLTAKHGCEFVGIADAKASYFPPSYSTHENEIHAALRNRAAKMGGNLVISNFYRKPPQGVVMKCPETYFREES